MTRWHDEGASGTTRERAIRSLAGRARAGNRLQVALVQLLVEGGEPARNLARAVETLRLAAARGCDVALLPECLDLGWTHPSAKTEAQPIPGRYSDVLAAAARELGLYVCAGLTERAGARTFNAVVLISPTGELLLKYRKINVLTAAHEFYEIGDTLSVVDTPIGRIGVNICADNYFDALEIGHTLARMGAQIILSPSSWTIDYAQREASNPYGDKWLRPLRMLAELYGLVILTATSVGYIVGGPYEGKKMVGCSLAVGPNGVIAQGSYNELSSEVIVAEFDVPVRTEKGTQIGEMLRRRGYYGAAL